MVGRSFEIRLFAFVSGFFCTNPERVGHAHVNLIKGLAFTGPVKFSLTFTNSIFKQPLKNNPIHELRTSPNSAANKEWKPWTEISIQEQFKDISWIHDNKHQTSVANKPVQIENSIHPLEVTEEWRSELFFKRPNSLLAEIIIVESASSSDPDAAFKNSAVDADGVSAAKWLRDRQEALQNMQKVQGFSREKFVYNPKEISSFFSKRPNLVLCRMAEAALAFSKWGAAVTLDRWMGRDVSSLVRRNRAGQLRDILSRLGPTGVKAGQALSNRPDLVGPDYMQELQKLQDAVEPFPSQEAAGIVEAELGAGLDEIFEQLSPQPVASASLGQVYRGRLRGMPAGREVAVKVQRPGLEKSIPLDMLILRSLARLARQGLGLRSDLAAIVDEFAQRLYEEMDYEKEADNAERFQRLYGSIPGLVVPKVYRDFTRRRVLVMEWICGSKPPWSQTPLSGIAVRPDPDLLREWSALIKIGVQCNLKQLLDDGFFHADPHPGNLLRTEDGKLAYLDFGMMSYLNPERRYALIGAIAHLINRDYRLLARDFQELEFLGSDFTDLDGMARELERAFGDAAGGGRLADINFARLADNLANIAFRYPFRIPAYYSLIIRSLTILEGIALSANPNFKIVDEAYPYVARRLLYDQSPELQEALAEVMLDDQGRIKWGRLVGLTAAVSGGPAQPVQPYEGEAALNSDMLRAVVEFLVSDCGRRYVDAAVEDAVELADTLQLTLGVAATLASGGLLPPPPDRPSRSRLETFRRLATSVASSLSKTLRVTNAGAPPPDLASLLRQPGLLGPPVTVALQGIGVTDPDLQRRVVDEVDRVLRVVAYRLAEMNTRRFLRAGTEALIQAFEGRQAVQSSN